MKTWPISSIPSQQRLQWAVSLGLGSASRISFQSAWRQEGNSRYGMQSGISAIISGNKWVAAKSIRHIPLQPVNSDVILLSQTLLLILWATVVLLKKGNKPPLPRVRRAGQIIPYGVLAHSMRCGMVIPLPVTVKSVLIQNFAINAKTYRNPEIQTQPELFGKRPGGNITTVSTPTSRAASFEAELASENN